MYSFVTELGEKQRDKVLLTFRKELNVIPGNVTKDEFNWQQNFVNINYIYVKKEKDTHSYTSVLDFSQK